MSSETGKIEKKILFLKYSALVHLFAGGVGSAVAQCVTCPLDVVQTRLMSSKLNFSYSSVNATVMTGGGGGQAIQIHRPIIGINYFQVLLSYMKHMVNSEGLRSLYKGLTPGLIGIVPAKSAYFFCYASAKAKLNQSPQLKHHQHIVHSLSAMSAGLFTGTVTNPVWYIKTKLQLNDQQNPKTVIQIMQTGYRKHGLKCFFRGISASYVGVFETVIYFLLYEELKRLINLKQSQSKHKNFNALHLTYAALVSKISATTVMYPHEVVRTRLRQDVVDNSGQLKYKRFFQTLMTVAKEEGRRGLYGGFGTSLLRQLPHTAVTFLTYEAILHVLDT